MTVLLLCAAVAWPPVAYGGRNDAVEGEPRWSYGAIDVILYQTSWCPFCAKARRLLQDLDVSLTIYDIEEDGEKGAEMFAKSGSRGVPVVDIEGIIMRGFSETAICDAIEKKRRE